MIFTFFVLKKQTHNFNRHIHPLDHLFKRSKKFEKVLKSSKTSSEKFRFKQESEFVQTRFVLSALNNRQHQIHIGSVWCTSTEIHTHKLTKGNPKLPSTHTHAYKKRSKRRVFPASFFLCCCCTIAAAESEREREVGFRRSASSLV